MRESPGEEVAFVRGLEELQTARGKRIVRGNDNDFVGSLDTMRNIKLTAARRALKDAVNYLGFRSSRLGLGRMDGTLSATLEWSEEGPNNFDVDDSVRNAAYLALTDGGELVVIADAHVPGRDVFEPFPQLESVLGAWARSRGATLLGLEGDQWQSDRWSAYFKVPLTKMTIEDVDSLGMKAGAVVDAYLDGKPSPDVMRSILDAGLVDALVGLREGQAFECKRSLALENEHARLEMAKDLAAMANGGGAGVIVIGLETKKRQGDDEAVKVHPIRDAAKLARRIRRIADRLIFPPIDGLAVNSVPIGSGGEVVYCYVPKQAEELLPFLVAGAFVDRKVTGTMISIPRRRGDETLHASPASIHAFVAAGYALFRRAGNSRLDAG